MNKILLGLIVLAIILSGCTAEQTENTDATEPADETPVEEPMDETPAEEPMEDIPSEEPPVDEPAEDLEEEPAGLIE